MNVWTKLLIPALLITPSGAFIACARADDMERRATGLPIFFSIRLPAVPTDEELESQHARIGQIEVEVKEVFQDEVRALAAPYRIANGLHIGTRKPTITQQLLFHAGEPYKRSTLDETERLLRAQRYLREATIEPIRYNDDGTVDLRVRVHDVWTLSPGFSFESAIRLAKQSIASRCASATSISAAARACTAKLRSRCVSTRFR